MLHVRWCDYPGTGQHCTCIGAFTHFLETMVKPIKLFDCGVKNSTNLSTSQTDVQLPKNQADPNGKTKGNGRSSPDSLSRTENYTAKHGRHAPG